MEVLSTAYKLLRDIFDPATEGDPSHTKPVLENIKGDKSKQTVGLKVHRNILRI